VTVPPIAIERLGSPSFRARYGLAAAYMCGAMYKGVASVALVERAGRAGLLACFGSGGLPAERVEAAAAQLASSLGRDHPWGLNLLCNVTRPEREDRVVDICLRHCVPVVEAAAFMSITPALARLRARTLVAAADGGVGRTLRIIAKLSRPEVAEAFLAPAPTALLERLRLAGAITADQAALAARVPMADDMVVEADSAGHTDRGVAQVLVPVIVAQRDRLALPGEPVHIGVGGGIGTPAAAVAALMLGADFIVTGSINQCTVESGASEAVKDMLMVMRVQDTGYAPAGDMFELGARVQVLRRGVLFPNRAEQLFELWQRHASLEEIAPAVRARLEADVFRKPLADVWTEAREHLRRSDPATCERAEREPKARMAAVFKWYFGLSTRVAMAGDTARRVDFQIHTGPALGACNQWLMGSGLEDWRQRHVDGLAFRLLTSTARLLAERLDLYRPDAIASAVASATHATA